MKGLVCIFSIIIMTINLSYSQVKTSIDTIGTFSDGRDGHVYKWIKIGTQIWMAKNLAYLPKVDKTKQGYLVKPYYHVYNYHRTNVDSAKATSNYATYGVLYNWHAAKESCPTGWHLPNNVEWATLINYLGGEIEANRKMKESGSEHWKCLKEDDTNSSGFTALPGGGLVGLELNFNGIGYFGAWWSLDNDNYNGWRQRLECNDSDLDREAKFQFFSIRCIKD